MKVDFTLADGRPVKALQDLVAQRIKALNEDASDAVVATAITALKAIRARTRKSRSTAVVKEELADKLSIAVYEMIGLRVGFTGRSHSLCVRDEAGNRLPDIKPWVRVAPSELTSSKVFRIYLSGDRVAAWPFQRRVSHMVARNLPQAKAIAKERFSKIVAKSSGLARDALSRSMQLASSRPASYSSKRANVLARQGVVVVRKFHLGKNETALERGIEIEDNLRYAVDALEGGAPTVQTALAKAANQITGMINAHMNKHAATFFNDKGAKELKTPFPASCFDPNTGDYIA